MIDVIQSSYLVSKVSYECALKGNLKVIQQRQETVKVFALGSNFWALIQERSSVLSNKIST